MENRSQETNLEVLQSKLRKRPYLRDNKEKEKMVKEMVTHASTFAWKSHGLSSSVGYSPFGCKKSDRIECDLPHLQGGR